jgi:large subunit ribosomal protein L29
MALKDVERKPLDMAQLRELPDEELKAELERLKEAGFRLRLRAATEDITTDNPMRFRNMRRNIARIHTVLRERTRG